MSKAGSGPLTSLKDLKSHISSHDKKHAPVSNSGKSANAGNNFSIELKRKVTVKRYPVLADITFCWERPDVVSLLTAIQGSQTMPPRLVDYLHREKLWDKSGKMLTEKGANVAETGRFEAKERGLYHIWYTYDDALLGTRPLLIQRDNAFSQPERNILKKGNDARNSAFNSEKTMSIRLLEEIYNDKKSEVKSGLLPVQSIMPQVICSAEASAELELQWELNTSKSMLTLTGNLDVKDASAKKNGEKLYSLDLEWQEFAEQLPLLMKSIASQLDMAWHESTGRMQLALTKARQYSGAVQSFAINHEVIKKLQVDKLGSFEQVEIRHLPIKPENKADADEWHKAWLEDFHAKEYRPGNETCHQQSLWLDDEAIAGFDLSIKAGMALLETFRRENQPETYWRVAAMADLSPAQSNKLHLPVTFMHGEELEKEKLLRQFCGGDEVSHLIYSDRYVRTPRHGRTLQQLTRSFPDAEGMLLTMTDEAELPELWQRQLFVKNSENHGRYWIMKGKSVHCWECTSGLDFIREKDDRYVVEGSPAFIPRSLNELPKYLQNALQDLLKEECL